MHAPTDTIAAVSSPPGRAVRGLIRIAGPATADALEHLLQPHDATTRHLTPVRLRQPDLPALLLRFDSPASYTGEDAAELQLPGNPALLDRVLKHLLDTPGQTVRLAEPGEFTFRAYAAGKLDLTQAEGIGATIAAVSDSQLAAATLLRQGKLGSVAETLVDRLGSLLALIEAGIDFTDQEDVTPIAPDLLRTRLDHVADQLTQLRSRSRSWNALEALPRVVLVGQPSAGKSTLFNALLGTTRAVIDPAPGTTRDAIAEPITLADQHHRPVEAMLVDLAGLDQTLPDHRNHPEHETPNNALNNTHNDAQNAAHNAIERADLVLRITDIQAPHPIALRCQAPILDVQTKCDLPAHPHTHPHTLPQAQANQPPPLRVSVLADTGLDALRRAIVTALADRAVSLRADTLALQPRHEQAIDRARLALHDADALLEYRPDPDRLPDIELLADAARRALDALASLGGRLTPDQVIGKVFATFCVGK